jgi:NADPH-dependent curcumin reductase CurA
MALARQQGLAALDLKNRDAQALLDMVGWLKAGQVKIRETVVDGLENAPSAFIDLFRGANHGKMLVRLVADAASGEWGP